MKYLIGIHSNLYVNARKPTVPRSPVTTATRSHRSPDGGDFPGNIHRLAAGGYDWMTVEIFLATSTALL
jgi:hypothetical protein